MGKFLILQIFLAVSIYNVNAGYLTRSLQERVDRQMKSDIMVEMYDHFGEDEYGHISRQFFPTRASKIYAVVSALRTFSNRSQKQLLKFLKSRAVEYESFWITNQVYVKNADPRIILSIASFGGVKEIREEGKTPFVLPVEVDNATRRNGDDLTWGLEIIEAKGAWKHTMGEDVKVGVIDTGARHTHEAIKHSFIGLENNGWFDPYTKSPTPIDEHGHGTHVTGTIAGIKGIGVAPNAKWMICRGCDKETCSDSALMACGQFMTCPTDPNGLNEDCSKAPHLVSNSLGGLVIISGNFFDEILKAWIAAGILPIFAFGNNGPFCETGGYPGVNEEVIAVGATTKTDGLAVFSSKGPYLFTRIKPDISAPGDKVYSSHNEHDTDYKEMSGTSMACPHLSGVVALMYSANKNLTMEQVKMALYDTAEKMALKKTGFNCGFVSESNYPNNAYGYGRVNARAAVEAVIKKYK